MCVLPFANLSGDAEQEIFCDGFSQDIVTELARWRLLEVPLPAWASLSTRYPWLRVARIARELNVRFVIEGSVHGWVIASVSPCS